MKYIQTYKSKELLDSALKLETNNSEVLILTKEETTLYNCFSKPRTLQEVYQDVYHNDSIHIEFFNGTIVKWYQLGLLTII